MFNKFASSHSRGCTNIDQIGMPMDFDTHTTTSERSLVLVCRSWNPWGWNHTTHQHQHPLHHQHIYEHGVVTFHWISSKCRPWRSSSCHSSKGIQHSSLWEVLPTLLRCSEFNSTYIQLLNPILLRGRHIWPQFFFWMIILAKLLKWLCSSFVNLLYGDRT